MKPLKWALFGALVALWACPAAHANKPTRISAYPTFSGYGMRIPVTPEDAERPKRNATFVVPESEVTVRSNSSEELQEGSANSANEGDGTEEEGMSSVNRMGIPARVSRRKLTLGARTALNARTAEGGSSGATTHRNVPWPPSIRPPNIAEADGFGPPSPPVAKPPSPPNGSPPAPPTLAVTPSPPAIPPTISSPSPPPGADDAQVTDIKCMDSGASSSLMALLTLPVGYSAIPVFEDRPTVDPTINTECRMIPTKITNDMFQLIARDLERCGVKKCRQANGEIWLCLLLRFPLVNGLKLPEDEIIQIKCRPQDKMAQDTHVLRVATAMYAAKGAINHPNNPSVFEGGQQEFQCEIGLFRKLRGTNIFADQVTSQVELELGEEVQLRSIVRGGDGWQYSQLTTIIIQKVGIPRERSLLSAADLVFADGCRNPAYKLIAREHPKRDPRNPLINNFTFRIFMFQDMEVGDNLMITANVIGCIEAEDCAPVNCGGEAGEDTVGFGRKKRGVQHFTFRQVIPASEFLKAKGQPPYPPHLPAQPVPPPRYRTRRTASHAHGSQMNTTNWERNLAIKVKIPETKVRQESIESEECRLYLFITLGVAGVFCISSVVFVVFTFLRGRSSSKKALQNAPVATMPSQQFPPPPSNASSTMSSLGESELSPSPLRNVSVPATVRQRKRDVNAELLNVFGGEQAYPYGAAHYPGMFNYYGYMVVPRKPSDKAEKRSLRALKKKQRRERPEVTCNCSSSSDHDSSFSSENHTAIIRISSSSSSSTSGDSDATSTPCASHRPKPMPRLTREGGNDNIYSEILDGEHPTMV